MTADARQTLLTLLAARAPDATVCPSEVARAMAAGANWRAVMPAVHSAVDLLLAEGAIRLSWKGQRPSTRAGPYRIGIKVRDKTDRGCRCYRQCPLWVDSRHSCDHHKPIELLIILGQRSCATSRGALSAAYTSSRFLQGRLICHSVPHRAYSRINSRFFRAETFFA